MSKKSDFVTKLIDQVALRHPVPKSPMEGVNLLEQGAVLVLMRHMTQSQAEASVKALKAAYEDWNEIRVSQSQEIAQSLRTSARKKGIALLKDRRDAAMALKEYLQDVFQQTHHLDLEELREDEATAGKTAASLTVLGLAGASYLMYVAADEQIPVHMPLVKLLDKLDLVPRTSSIKKARVSIEGIVPKGKELPFTLAIHEALERWDDENEPIFMTVPVIQDTAYGKKCHKERTNAIAKAEAARKREEERIRKEEERERTKAEAEAKKRARELERKRVAEEKKLAAARAKAAAADKKRKEAEKKRADAKKAKEAAQKAAAAKKAAAKKAAAKKAASKKAASKKAASKKAAAKKTASRKATTSRKPASKKAAAKKPAATKKKAAKKPAAKKSAAKKPAAKKSAAKKPAAKKAAAKKPAAKKKAARKKPVARRR
ncbi:MAG: hypothetical protein AAF957_02920 [Planctomycetota bacterium]